MRKLSNEIDLIADQRVAGADAQVILDAPVALLVRAVRMTPNSIDTLSAHFGEFELVVTVSLHSSLPLLADNGAASHVRQLDATTLGGARRGSTKNAVSVEEFSN